jgi:hypothetical protein
MNSQTMLLKTLARWLVLMLARLRVRVRLGVKGFRFRAGVSNCCFLVSAFNKYLRVGSSLLISDFNSAIKYKRKNPQTLSPPWNEFDKWVNVEIVVGKQLILCSWGHSKFWYLSSDLHLDTILSRRSMYNSFNLMAWFLL